MTTYADLLCHFNGSGTAAPIDSAHNFTFTAGSSNATQSGTRPVFGAGAAELLATGYWEIGSSQNLSKLDFGSGDFTIRFRMVADSLAANRHLFGLQSAANNSNRCFRVRLTTAGTLSLIVAYFNGSIFTTSQVNITGITTGTTYAISFERHGDTLYAYKDGTQIASAALSSGQALNAVVAGSHVFHVGAEFGGTESFVGMLDELAIFKGTSLAAGASSYTVETSAFTDPPYFVSGWFATHFGTPNAGHRASGWLATHFGTPRSKQTFAVAGWKAVHFGTPLETQFIKVRTMGVRTFFGTPTTPTWRSFTASGWMPTKFGHVVSLVYVPGSLNRTLPVAPTRTIHFGHPVMHATMTGQATGLRSIHFGTPVAAVRQRLQVSGFASGVHFGTPTLAMRQRARGFHAVHFGTPKVVAVLPVASLGLRTHFGTPTYTRSNAHQAHGWFGARFGTPRVKQGTCCRATGWLATSFGTPATHGVYRVRSIAPATYFGTPQMVRNPRC